MAARLLFIGMWNFADDLGRLSLSAKSIKAKVFPSDEVTSENILGMIRELSQIGLLLVYTVEDREYLQITGWQHQRIDKPQPGRCPSPVNGYSKNVRGMVATDRIGEDRKGEDSNSETIVSGADAPLDPSVPEREYFVRGREILGDKAGAIIAKLLKAKGGNVALARSALETASQKQRPSEYIAACCRDGPVARPLTAHQQKQQTAKDILDDLENFATGSGGGDQTHSGLLRYDPGNRPQSIRGGSSGYLDDLSEAGHRSRN